MCDSTFALDRGFAEGEAEGKEVACNRRLGTSPVFRCEVSRRTAANDGTQPARELEVDEPHGIRTTRSVEEDDIVGFDVAMHTPPRVQVEERAEYTDGTGHHRVWFSNRHCESGAPTRWSSTRVIPRYPTALARTALSAG